MPLNNTPPILPIRPSDSSSRFLAKDLILAYPALESGNVLRNFGSLGSIADLSLSGVMRTRYNGIIGLRFDGTSSIASNSTINMLVPQKWSFAYWLKIDSVPGSERSILSLQGPTEAHLRAWADSQGMWAWQKHSIADSYSILPPTDFPTDNMILVVAVYDDPLLPPVQVRSNQGLTSLPVQPDSYVVFNEATGSPNSNVTGIYLGGSPGNTNMFGGVLGPVYVWSRPVSESEIWQLWQDPYAPFRRGTEQIIVPSAMTNSQSASLQGIGKQSDAKPSFNDNYALYINVDDDILYVVNPVDTVVSDSQSLDTITVFDNYNYRQLPSDTLAADAPFSLITLNVDDDYSYNTLPSDIVVAPETGVSNISSITVTDGYTYVDESTDSVNSDIQYPHIITITDTVQYSAVPTETVAA